MLKKITDGISIALNAAFGEGYEIYTENVEQGLAEPCFFVKWVDDVETPRLKDRVRRDYSFDVAYFPKNGNTEMMDASDRITEALRYITLTDGDILRASEVSSGITDDVLHVSLTYSVHMNKVDKGALMEDLSLSQSLKE